MADKIRKYELGDVNELPIKGSTTIEEGDCVGVVAASGYARPVGATTDRFAGFAVSRRDNSAGADGAMNVRVNKRGSVVLAVTSAAITSVGLQVYASGADTFTLDKDDGPYVGKISRYIDSTHQVVDFDAAMVKPDEAAAG